MNIKNEHLQAKYYFLTWQYEHCHDGDEWVAIVGSMDELNNIYKKTLEEAALNNDDNYDRRGLSLKAYEYRNNKFFPITISD